MKTFNNDEKLKLEVVKNLEHHQKLDAFMQGEWLTKEKIDVNVFKGCFYGCTMQTNESPIDKFSKKYSIDLWYCYLTEKIFEGLPDGEYQKFPLESIKILPIGIEFNKIKSKFFYHLLMDEDFGQINYCEDNKDGIKSIKKCAELFKNDFNDIDQSAARSAAESARSAARSAAWSARSAAWSARSAAESAAWSAAESVYYVWMKEMLFEIIKSI